MREAADDGHGVADVLEGVAHEDEIEVRLRKLEVLDESLMEGAAGTLVRGARLGRRVDRDDLLG